MGTNTRAIAAEYRLAHWAGIMREREESGLSIRAFCEREGFHENSYFRWQRKLRETVAEEMAKAGKEPTDIVPAGFAEVKMVEQSVPAGATAPCQNNISIEMPGIRITADGGYPVEKLTAVIREMAVRT